MDAPVIPSELVEAAAKALAGEPREGVLRMGYVALTRARRSVSLLRPSVPEHLDLSLDGRMSLAA